jgi:hypothetical protein
VRWRGQKYSQGRSGIFVVCWEKITGIFAERLKNIWRIFSGNICWGDPEIY